MMQTFKRVIENLFKPKISPKDAFLSQRYQRHNQRRLEHLASLGLNIAGHSVLEVGAGIGDHTSFFIDRGCKIVSSDVRLKNVETLRSRYPDIEILRLDLDSPPKGFYTEFDIVYCYGVLYHLKYPAQALQFMAKSCRKMLLLETCVSFGNESKLNPYEEDSLNPTQSHTGIGCRPTRKWVYDHLKRHFEFVYLPITQPYHEEFPVDWTCDPSGKLLTRSVFIASRQRMENKKLLEEIPLLQKRL